MDCGNEVLCSLRGRIFWERYIRFVLLQAENRRTYIYQREVIENIALGLPRKISRIESKPNKNSVTNILRITGYKRVERWFIFPSSLRRSNTRNYYNMLNFWCGIIVVNSVQKDFYLEFLLLWRHPNRNHRTLKRGWPYGTRTVKQ